MVSRIWVCVFSFVILPYLIAKPVSLNKLIEAEEALSSENIPTVSKPDFTAKPTSLNKLIEAGERHKQQNRPRLVQPKANQEKTTKLRTGILASGLNKLTKTVSGTVFSQRNSPLHYRKTFEIKSPVKPKRVTLFQRTNRIRNQSAKRDTHQHGAINQKYVPLLRNLGVLFDIIGGESSETYGDYSGESEERVCTCVSKRTGRESRQKATASARVAVTETAPPTQAPSTTTLTPAPNNLGTVRRDQNVSLLFTRNTTGVWRNNIGVDERSRTAHLGSAEGHIAGDSGDNERDPRDGEAGTDPEDDEEDPDGLAGDDARDVRSTGMGGHGRGFVGKSVVSHKFKASSNKTAEGLGGHVPQYEGEIQFEIRTDKAKGSRALPESDSRLRASKEIQTAEEKGTFEYGDSSNQQLSDGNGEDTKENQKLRGTYEGVSLDTVSKQDDKYVMIYDGYSVARDVNGKNTLAEKTITIHS